MERDIIEIENKTKEIFNECVNISNEIENIFDNSENLSDAGSDSFGLNLMLDGKIIDIINLYELIGIKKSFLEVKSLININK